MNGDVPARVTEMWVECGINPPAPNKGVKLQFKPRKSEFSKAFSFVSKPNYIQYFNTAKNFRRDILQ